MISLSRTLRTRTNRALTPVIATVFMAGVAATFILLANFLTTTDAWHYAEFERVEMQASQCVIDNYGNWNITLKLKNTGGSTAILIFVLINDEEVSTYGASGPTTALKTCTTSMTKNPVFTIMSGQTRNVNIWIGKDHSTLTSGTTINIKLHSSGGIDYIKLVGLV